MAVRKNGTEVPSSRKTMMSQCGFLESPHRLQFEKTTVGQSTEIAFHLQRFHDDVAFIPPSKSEKSAERIRVLLEFLAPRIRVFASKVGMRITGTLNIGSSFDQTQVIAPTETDVLLLFENFNMKVESLTDGYAILPLRRYRPGTKADQWRFGRSDCGAFLSPIVTARSVHAILERSLRVCTQTIVQPLQPGSTHVAVFMNNGKQRLNIIPATYAQRLDVYIVSKPYAYDEDSHSHMLWRMCYDHKESRVIDRMTRADRGMHVKALRILKALSQKEHTLGGLTSFHLKTTLLYVYDAILDRDTRWQRRTLDACFMSLLVQLLHNLTIKHLPHFFAAEHDLFSGIPPRLLENLRTRIAYLTLNTGEIVRILSKHAKAQPKTTR